MSSVDSKGTVRIYNNTGKVIDMLVPGSVQNAFNLIHDGKWTNAHKIECTYGVEQCVAQRTVDGKWEFIHD